MALALRKRRPFSISFTAIQNSTCALNFCAVVLAPMIVVLVPQYEIEKHTTLATILTSVT